jgi:hypothetical protein
VAPTVAVRPRCEAYPNLEPPAPNLELVRSLWVRRVAFVMRVRHPVRVELIIDS